MPQRLVGDDLELFNPSADLLTDDERIHISYQRARAVARAYDLNISDVLHLTPKFWQLHQDLIAPVDYAAFSLLTIQFNLAAGTLAPFAVHNPHYKSLLDRILRFDVSAQYMLTEVGHGLDARNLETSATLLPNGEFDLHTPNLNAAKIMPPTWPRKSFPRVAVVFARLLASDEDRGLRPFIVWLNDGERMCDGVIAKMLPPRAGAKPLDHSITSFTHVRLPSSALLGSIERPSNERENFLSITWRLGVGALALTMSTIPMMKRSVFVAGKYSIHRQILGPETKPTSIISLRTQQQPILHGLAQIAVFEAYAEESILLFQDPNLQPTVRHAIGAIFKAVMSQAVHPTLYALSERCGARGLYAYNHIIESQLDCRVSSIAEGDTLALSIRLATELLLDRYQLPPARYSTCILAQHEKGLMAESRALLRGIAGGHRSDEFNALILPRCQSIVEAVGHRMAYEAAAKAGVPSDLLSLYKIGVMLHDPSWYVQHTNATRESMFAEESRALDAVLPRLNTLLDQTGAERYCTSPILSHDSWEAFVDQLETHGDGKSTCISRSSSKL
ncbi:acyl-CoA dehydrogenase NM domain-like protein [Aspergillus alliaceus]|uniref:acyl-CoA dehydrogenase NM domain-like protein n=1 Tax=Petromyces alliaceus TaxID=209559 RepID=UPI0012A5D69B|nr:acyl-CoA dehydrogenase NM domain-like protein [Aspergillus alliaceus]KAB8237929.1 acyl-CoA dehydrogenase NM domain-like protein [Aspergillus alliaceus]